MKILELSPDVLEYEQNQSDEDIAFFGEIALRAGGPALDLGCGTGRLSIALAEHGLEVVGLDLAESVLCALHQKLRDGRQEIRQRIRLVRADMRRFSLKNKFACAVCSSNTLLLAGNCKSVKNVLACTAFHLRTGGLLVLDVAAIDEGTMAALEQYPPEEEPDVVFERADGRKLQRTHSLKIITPPTHDDAARAAVTYRYYNAEGNVSGQRIEELALIDPEELLSLIKNSGFDIRETFGWYDHRPYNENERKLLAVAQKRG